MIGRKGRNDERRYWPWGAGVENSGRPGAPLVGWLGVIAWTVSHGERLG